MAAAEISLRPEDLKQDRRLRYLEFVRVAALWAMACLVGIYGLAKAFAGPLRPGVEGVECAVAAVAGPIYDLLRGVPLDLLRFADGKVDALLLAAVPPPVRDASRGACAAARSVAGEARRSGAVAAAREIVSMCEPAARGMIARYEPAAEHSAVAAWRSLNRIPMFPMAAQVAVHAAACWIERYNRMVEAADSPWRESFRSSLSIGSRRCSAATGKSTRRRRTEGSRRSCSSARRKVTGRRRRSDLLCSGTAADSPVMMM